MSDLYHYWGADLSVSASGDLLGVDGTTAGQQRILRRLLTNPAGNSLNGAPPDPGDYLFHLDYGAGLPRWVGKNVDIPRVRALVRGQLMKENIVAKQPLPVVTVTEITNGISISIQYNDALTKRPVFLSFDVNK